MDWEQLQDHIVICGWNSKAEIIVAEYEASQRLNGTPIVAIDGDEDQAKKVRENPHPAVAVPLYAAIMRVTWGSPFSQGQPAGRG